MELRKQGNITHMKDMMQQLHYRAQRLSNQEEVDTAATPVTISARVLMAAYMINFGPQNVFESMDAAETKLLESATNLLKRFEAILACLSTGMKFEDVPRELTLDFPNIINTYLRDFETWKTPDGQKLRTRIEHAINALNAALMQLPESGMEFDRVEITKQMERMRQKYTCCFGAEALEELDQRMLRGQAVACIDIPHSFLNDGLGGTNEQMTYELFLDANYKLEVEADERGNKLFSNAWETIAADYNRGDFETTLRTCKTMQKQFANFFNDVGTVQAADLKTEVSALLDDSNVVNCLATWESAVSLVERLVEIMFILQQHSTHQETEAKWELILAGMGEEDKGRALAQALKFLYECCVSMSIYIANKRLRLITPVILEHGTEYLRGKFQAGLDTGKITLQRTTDWLTPVLHDLKVKELRKILGDDFSALGKVHRAAMVNLIITEGKLDGASMPEVFRFDLKRFKTFSAAYDKAVVCASIMRTIGNFVEGADDTNESNIESVVSSLCSETNPSLMALISLMVLAHNPKNEAEVDQLFNCISQTKLQTMLSAEQLEEMRVGMQLCLEDTSDVRAIV